MPLKKDFREPRHRVSFAFSGAVVPDVHVGDEFELPPIEYVHVKAILFGVLGHHPEHVA